MMGKLCKLLCDAGIYAKIKDPSNMIFGEEEMFIFSSHTHRSLY